MIIRVVFKLNKQLGYDNIGFDYKGYENAEVGDIVVVNTRYGYGIAKVVAIDVKDSQFAESDLREVKTIVESAAAQRQEVERKAQIKELAKTIRRNNLENQIKNLGLTEVQMTLVKEMTDDELKDFLIYLQ